MIGNIIPLTIAGMASPGRRQGTPSEFRKAFTGRVRGAREKIGYTYAQTARALTAASGREIFADSYRKWESGSQKTLLPHDLIMHFCDLTRTHPWDLLAPVDIPRTGPADRRRKGVELSIVPGANNANANRPINTRMADRAPGLGAVRRKARGDESRGSE